MTAAAVAQQLKAAFDSGPTRGQAVLQSLYAESVDYGHEPPLPSDGAVPAEKLKAGNGAEADMVAKALPDISYDDVAVEVTGDEVRLAFAICGTATTGVAVRIPTEMRCSVREGSIVGLVHVMSDAAIAGWTEVAKAGGFGVPDSFSTAE